MDKIVKNYLTVAAVTGVISAICFVDYHKREKKLKEARHQALENIEAQTDLMMRMMCSGETDSFMKELADSYPNGITVSQITKELQQWQMEATERKKLAYLDKKMKELNGED